MSAADSVPTGRPARKRGLMALLRRGRLPGRRAATLLPLAILSIASTGAIAVGDAAPTPTGSAATEPAGTLPGGSSVPAHPLESPASVSDSGAITGSVGGVDGDSARIVATSSTNGIPSAALAAYQRAESVINAADPTCRLGWQLVAAIGRVESDHGRYGGSALDPEGVARPAIIGPVLDGRNGTALIRDTDGGEYDGDSRYDRAVGPMQFIPSTWSVVGVDADNDGVRDPADVDDAALAAAVYLCSGDEDLSAAPGQRAAVFRYNHSDAYVDQVLSIAEAYLDGDYTSGPGPLLSARPTFPTSTGPLVPLGSAAGSGPRPGAGPAGQPVEGLQAPAAPAQPDAEPVPTAPVPTEPVPTEPVPTEPAPTEPVPTEPVPTEPVPTEPAPTEPIPTEPAPTEPVPTEPVPTDPPAVPEPGTLLLADAVEHCDGLGLVDDPAVAGDDHDLCVATYALPGEVPAVPETPAPSPLRDESRPAGD